MNYNENYRNITLSTRVSAQQKAEYSKIAASHNVSVSEWILSIIEMNKTSYGTIGDPTPKEVSLNRQIDLSEKKIKKLKAQRETSDQFAATMQERSNRAVQDRDDSNYALKEALAENQKLKKQLEVAESLVGEPKENNNSKFAVQASVSLLTIFTMILLRGR